MAALSALFGGGSAPDPWPANKDGFRIVAFADPGFVGAGYTALCTVGLSAHVTRDAGADGVDTRQELLFVARSADLTRGVRTFVHLAAAKYVAEDIALGRAVKLGSVVPHAEPLDEGITTRALLSFCPLDLGEGELTHVAPPVRLRWLIPITADELRFITGAPKTGVAINALLDHFAAVQVDAYDLRRASAVPGALLPLQPPHSLPPLLLERTLPLLEQHFRAPSSTPLNPKSFWSALVDGAAQLFSSAAEPAAQSVVLAPPATSASSMYRWVLLPWPDRTLSVFCTVGACNRRHEFCFVARTTQARPHNGISDAALVAALYEATDYFVDALQSSTSWAADGRAYVFHQPPVSAWTLQGLFAMPPIIDVPSVLAASGAVLLQLVPMVEGDCDFYNRHPLGQKDAAVALRRLLRQDRNVADLTRSITAGLDAEVNEVVQKRIPATLSPGLHAAFERRVAGAPPPNLIDSVRAGLDHLDLAALARSTGLPVVIETICSFDDGRHQRFVYIDLAPPLTEAGIASAVFALLTDDEVDRVIKISTLPILFDKSADIHVAFTSPDQKIYFPERGCAPTTAAERVRSDVKQQYLNVRSGSGQGSGSGLGLELGKGEA